MIGRHIAPVGAGPSAVGASPGTSKLSTPRLALSVGIDTPPPTGGVGSGGSTSSIICRDSFTAVAHDDREPFDKARPAQATYN